MKRFGVCFCEKKIVHGWKYLCHQAKICNIQKNLRTKHFISTNLVSGHFTSIVRKKKKKMYAELSAKPLNHGPSRHMYISVHWYKLFLQLRPNACRCEKQNSAENAMIWKGPQQNVNLKKRWARELKWGRTKKKTKYCKNVLHSHNAHWKLPVTNTSIELRKVTLQECRVKYSKAYLWMQLLIDICSSDF